MGGAPVGIVLPIAPKILYRPGNNYIKQVPQGALSSVSDMISDLQLHPKYPWAGQVNHSSDQIKVHHTLWSCVICCTHEHPLQNCPFLANYKIEKLNKEPHPSDLESNFLIRLLHW